MHGFEIETVVYAHYFSIVILQSISLPLLHGSTGLEEPWLPHISFLHSFM